jgi:hypothetical protein
MKLLVIADVINDVYNNGVVKSRHKIDRRDFIVLCRAAKGSVVRARYIQERQQGNVSAFVGDQIRAAEFKTAKSDRGILTVDIDFDVTKIVKLPDGNGVIRITPINDGGKIDYSINFSKAPAGSEFMFCTNEFLDDTGELIYIMSSNEIRLFGSDVEQVEMVYVADDDDVDVPEDIAWDMINDVLGIVLRVEGFPVDKTDDQNPNVQQINSKISAAQVA